MKLVKTLSILVALFSGILILTSCYNEANAVTNPTKKVVTTLTWHSIEDLAALQKKAPKKVIVDVYTDWCKWCKVMDEKTFSDTALIGYLNDNYYMVKLNAETKTDLQFKGKSYPFVQSGKRGYNQLAVDLMKGKLSYPSFAVLDANLNTVDITRGFKDVDAFKAFLEKVEL